MKTARERAQELWDGLPASAMVAIDLNWRAGAPAWVNEVERMFKEYARDQRHMIADRLAANDALPMTTKDAHTVAMNTPFPGE